MNSTRFALILFALVALLLATTQSQASGLATTLNVPDGGSMALLLGMALLGLAGLRRLLGGSKKQ